MFGDIYNSYLKAANTVSHSRWQSAPIAAWYARLVLQWYDFERLVQVVRLQKTTRLDTLKLSVFLSLFSFSLSFPLYQLSKLPCNGEWRKIKIQFFIYNTVVWGCIGVWFQIHLFALNLKENSLIDEITNWLITPFLMGLFQTLKFFFVIWMMVCTLLFMHYNKTNLFFV